MLLGDSKLRVWLVEALRPIQKLIRYASRIKRREDASSFMGVTCVRGVRCCRTVSVGVGGLPELSILSVRQDAPLLPCSMREVEQTADGKKDVSKKATAFTIFGRYATSFR